MYINNLAPEAIIRVVNCMLSADGIKPLVINPVGQRGHDVIGPLLVKPKCYWLLTQYIMIGAFRSAVSLHCFSVFVFLSVTLSVKSR